MSAINSDSVRAGASGAVSGYTIGNSCRFNDGDSARTELDAFGTPTSTTTFTISYWQKFTLSNIQGDLFASAKNSSGAGKITILTSGKMQWLMENTGGSADGKLVTTRVFRDFSAWMHFVWIWDTTNGTAGDRMRLYINGVEETAFDTDTQPTSSKASVTMNTAISHIIGSRPAFYDQPWDGYLAEFVFIDGQALAASSFGETDTNGNWVPIDPSSLTFGNNGFWLDFAVAPGTGNGAGTDVSGEGNHFTDSGLAANDQMNDSPTDDADNDVGNYAVLLGNLNNSGTQSEGNLKHSGSSASRSYSTMPFVGKTYMEVDAISYSGGVLSIGLVSHLWTVSNAMDGEPQPDDGFWGMDHSNFYADGGGVSNQYTGYSVPSAGESWMIAYDADTGELWLGENGTWFNSGDPDAGTGEVATIPAAKRGSMFMMVGGNGVQTANFGQQAMNHDVDVDEFTKNLHTGRFPAPTITDPSKYFQVDLYAGTSAEQVRTLTDAAGAAVEPDLVWIKERDDTVQHVLTDSVRGATKELNSNETTVESTVAQGLKSFDTSGYTLGTDDNYNDTGDNYVGWVWVENATPGFDIVSYTGNATARTISHSLSAAPEFIIVKRRSGNTGRWMVFHQDLDPSAPEDKHMGLDENSAVGDATNWNDTPPTSSVFSLGAQDDVNYNGSPFIAYCWVGVEGYSKFGSYEGNGATNGTFVWCGFRPRWVMVKSLDTSGTYDGWIIHDTARDTYNGADEDLAANETWSEDYAISAVGMDILSNGFKLRHTAYVNAANTYIFCAFAEFPFGGEDVSQARAR